MTRRFALIREEDVVAWGVQFPDGVTVLRWKSETASTVVYNSVDDVVLVHGHNGSTQILWVD